MSVSKIAIVDEEILKSIIYKFEEDGLEQKTMSGDTAIDKELLKSAFDKCVHFAKDALEQKTLSVQTGKALANHFLDLYFQQDALAHQIMELVCEKEAEYLQRRASPL